MPNKDTEQEPSIEEILTSIRQIISDDDDSPDDDPAPEPVADDESEEEVIELTEKIGRTPEPKPEVEDESGVEDESEIEVEMHDAEPEPEPPPSRKPAPRATSADSVLTDRAENAAFDAFSELAKKTAIEHGGITLEEIVRTELKPMLRQWLDKNLPQIIERLVQEELDRVAKRAFDD